MGFILNVRFDVILIHLVGPQSSPPLVSNSVLLAILERRWELTETERGGIRGAGGIRMGAGACLT